MNTGAGDARLRLRGIHRSFGGNAVLRGVDLEVGAGECLVLAGPNGAGKTTALAVAAGDLEPTSGQVRICGLDPHWRDDDTATREIAFVRDGALFYPDLSVEEHATLVALAHGLGRAAERKAHHALGTFGLTEYATASPDHLSAGMRQRLLLACTFVRPFTVLLLDEPSRSLDPAGRALLAEQLRIAKRAGAAVALATHHLEFASGFADQVALMEQGVISVSGSLAEVLGTPAAQRLGIDFG